MENGASQTPTYESKFNTDAIVDLVTHLQKSIRDYQVNQKKDEKIDTFVLLAALSNVAFSVSYSTLPANEEEQEISRVEAQRLVDGLLAKLDGMRAEYGIQWYSDIISITNLLGAVTEMYSNRRDHAIRAIISQQQNKQVSDAPTEGATPPEDVQ